MEEESHMDMQSNTNNSRNIKKEKAQKAFSRILRWTILASMLTFVLAATSLHALGYVAPSIHALCPYGGLESMLSIIAVGTFIKKIVLGTFVLFGVTVGLALIMRRSFCGQICAFGGLQEFFGKIGRKLFKKRPVVPKKLDRVLRYLKFVVLGVTIAMAWITASLWIIPYDPFNALGHLADFNALISTYLIGFIVLLVTLLGSIVYDRFFCKYLCPAGALYGAIGKVSPYAVRIDKEKCISCGLCNKVCPMNVEIMDCKKDKITDLECINCNECVNACPSSGALHTGFSRKKALSPIIATLLALALFFTPIIIASITGNMQLLPNKYTNAQTEETHQESGD
jgi:polyferredoxin